MNNTRNSEDNFALITGASGGIGLELVNIMASKGHNLVLVARSGKKLAAISEELTKKLPIKIKVFSADLTDEAERLKLISFIKEENLKINILVNNAGFGDSGCFAQADWEKNSRMIKLNILALTHLTREFIPHMIDEGYGRVLNVASIAGFLPGPLMSVYYASKSYVVSFSNAINSELKGTGVTVTTLSPGPVDTNFFNEAGASEAKINKIMKGASAHSVARFAYKRMMHGKRKAVQGIGNKLMLFGLRFIPSSLTNTLVKRLHT
ncbi:MAG: SDR family NAD(P)-dependent oxidoreductase [Omnitrophica WOR_2 bacterium]